MRIQEYHRIYAPEIEIEFQRCHGGKHYEGVVLKPKDDYVEL